MGDLEKLQLPRAVVRWRFKWTKFILCLVVIFLLTLFLQTGWSIIAGRLQKVAAATWGVIDKGYWAEVLFLRNEQILTVPAGGLLKLQVKDGARVPRGEILAILDQGTNLGTVAERDIVGRQNYRRYQTLIREEAVLGLDLRRINGDLAKHFKKAVRQKTNANLLALKQEKEQVIRNIQIIRAQSAGLRRQLAPLLKRWRFITAATPGCFVAQYDGFEGTLKPDYFDQLTLDDFDRKYPPQSSGSKVVAAEPFGRLIDPFTQMMAVKFDRAKTGSPFLGTNWRFKMPGGWKSAPLSGIKMFNSKMGAVLVAMSTEETDLLRIRRTKIFVVFQRITGVTVPIQALFKREDLTLVRIAGGEGYREKKVAVLAADGDKAVVSGIEAGTLIISR
jgi:hypothetical protein